MTQAAASEPRYDERDRSEPASEQEPGAARWDLAFGCALSFGPGESGGPLRVSIHMSDREAAAAMCVREVTPEQVREFAQYLIRLVDEEAGPHCRCGHPRFDHWALAGGGLVVIDGAECHRCVGCNIYRPTEQEGPVPA